MGKSPLVLLHRGMIADGQSAYEERVVARTYWIALMFVICAQGCAWISDADETFRKDVDGDGVLWPEDCDDNDATVALGDPWYADEDVDGHGAGDPLITCDPPKGYRELGDDCDDDDPAASPSLSEICDDIDNDCDGLTDDEDDSVDPLIWYADTDGDGAGDPLQTLAICKQPAGYVAEGNDCDDGNPALNPDADEVCDGIDNDCDGQIDESDALDAPLWFSDLDGDGFGDALAGINACEQPSMTTTNGLDCDDTAVEVGPAAAEICDGIDNNCNGLVDDDDVYILNPPVYYEDRDGDGYGVGVALQLACYAPPGFAAADGDCDDGDVAVSPAAPEICDGIDNNCDLEIDDADDDLVLAGAPPWFLDGDGDGFGDPLLLAPGQCAQPVGFVADDTDCDDAVQTIYPGAPELCDGVDNDCDLAVDEDGPTPRRWRRLRSGCRRGAVVCSGPWLRAVTRGLR